MNQTFSNGLQRIFINWTITNGSKFIHWICYHATTVASRLFFSRYWRRNFGDLKDLFASGGYMATVTDGSTSSMGFLLAFYCNRRWRFGVVVSRWSRSTKLTYAEPWSYDHMALYKCVYYYYYYYYYGWPCPGSTPGGGTLFRYVTIATQVDSAFYPPWDGKMSTSQRRWCFAAGKVTTGLAESNGSLSPGVWLKSPAGWLPVHRNQLRTHRSVTSMGSLYL